MALRSWPDRVSWREQEAVKGFMAAEAQKRERRQIDKFVKLNVQQISGTQRQVGGSSSSPSPSNHIVQQHAPSALQSVSRGLESVMPPAEAWLPYHGHSESVFVRFGSCSHM